MKKKFTVRLLNRIQQTALDILKPGFLTWAFGTYLIIKKHIPCNSATEYAWFTGALITAIGVHKILKHKNGNDIS